MDHTPFRSFDTQASLTFETPELQEERFSDYGSLNDGGPSSTESLESCGHLFEDRYGRTYHSFKAEQKYLFPNDNLEIDRMDMQFWAIHEIFQHKNFFAPLAQPPHNILDIGTGNGTWAIDVSDLYPSARVRGTDISPIQPRWVPPNVSFELHDCLKYPWGFHNAFDLIHTQVLQGLVVRDWDAFYTEAFANLKPGGWVESHEVNFHVRSPDNTLPRPSAIANWLDLMNKGLGVVAFDGDMLASAMQKAGFVNVEVREFWLPMGPWGDERQRRAGLLSLVATTDNMDGLSMGVFMDVLGMSYDEMRAFTLPCVQELRRQDVHCYMPLYAVLGQKPG